MELFELLVTGQGPAVDDDSPDLNVASLKQVQHAGITGLAAHFAPIADDEDDFAARALALAQIQCRAQDGVVQNVRFAGRCVDWRDGRSRCGKPVDRGSLRTEWAAHYRWTVIAAAHPLQFGECGGQVPGFAAKVHNLADCTAIGVECNLIVGAEGAGEGGIGLVDFLQGDIGDADVEHNCDREFKGVAGEISQSLRLSVFLYSEVPGQQAFDRAPVGIPYHDGNGNEVDGGRNCVEILFGIELVSGNRARG